MTMGLNWKLITEKYMKHFHILPIKQIILNNLVKENYKNITHGVINNENKCVKSCKLLLLFAFSSKTEQLNIKTTVCFNQG